MQINSSKFHPFDIMLFSKPFTSRKILFTFISANHCCFKLIGAPAIEKKKAIKIFTVLK